MLAPSLFKINRFGYEKTVALGKIENIKNGHVFPQHFSGTSLSRLRFKLNHFNLSMKNLAENHVDIVKKISWGPCLYDALTRFEVLIK